MAAVLSLLLQRPPTPPPPRFCPGVPVRTLPSSGVPVS